MHICLGVSVCGLLCADALAMCACVEGRGQPQVSFSVKLHVRFLTQGFSLCLVVFHKTGLLLSS